MGPHLQEVRGDGVPGYGQRRNSVGWSIALRLLPLLLHADAGAINAGRLGRRQAPPCNVIGHAGKKKL